MADLILILDESGSMGTQRFEMINQINKMVGTQKKLLLEDKKIATERVNFHIYRFNTKVKEPISHPLSTFPVFTDEHYSPGGNTALYDAIGEVIHRFEDSKNTTVLVIATDGEENASNEYQLSDIKAKLEEKKTKNDWTVIYLSENVETKKQGESFGVQGNSNVAVKKLGSAMNDCHLNSALNYAVRGEKSKCASSMAFFSSANNN